MATGAAACSSWQMATAWVAPTSTYASISGKAALRGADKAAEQAVDARSTSSIPVAFGAAGALSLVAAAHSRSRRMARKATMAPAAEVAAETEAPPPPPPPFDPAAQYGVTDPLGFFDPLGFTKVGDEDGFRKLRSAERKHGRVAMMAAVGAVAQHAVQFPGFESGPKGLGVLTTTPGQVGMAVLTAVCGAVELFLWTDRESEEPGDFGNPFSLERMPDGGPVDIGAGPRDRELNNGRMAMISIMGIMGAELATGKDAVEQLL